MNALFTATMTKISGSALSSDVGGRIFLDQAPEGTEFPYIVFFIVSSVPEDTFVKDIENTIIQFSIFSASAGATEITTIYGHLKALFKDAKLTVTGGVNVALEQENLATMLEDITTPSGTETVKHWAVDYSIIVQES